MWSDVIPFSLVFWGSPSAVSCSSFTRRYKGYVIFDISQSLLIFTYSEGVRPRRSLLFLVEKKKTVVNDKLSPQKPPGPRLWFPRTRLQHSPSSSTIELPPALAESGAYLYDRAAKVRLRILRCPTAFRNSALCLSRATISRAALNWSSEEAHLAKTIPNQRNRRRVSTYWLNREDSQSAVFREGDYSPTPAGKTLPHSIVPQNQVSEGDGT